MALSPILNLELVAPTQNDKTTTMNDLIVALEAATNGVATIDMSGGDVTLTFAQLTNYAVFRCNGASAPTTLTIPLISPNSTTVLRVFLVRNNGAYTITVGGATGTTVSLAAGTASIIECDGTNCVQYASGGIGPTGAVGPAGGGVSIDYLFNASTTDADPGAGQIALNSGTQNASTMLFVDPVDQHGESWLSVLETLDASTNAVKGQLRLFNKLDPTKWLVGELTARATASGYQKYAITVAGASVTNPFSNGDTLALTFSQAGDQPVSPVVPTATWATAAALPSNAYGNGTSGVGATLTATANGALTVDGGSPAVNDTVLVKNEGTQAHNGLYVVSAAGGAGAPWVLTRSASLNTGSRFVGTFLAVLEGSTNANSTWLCQNATAPTIGSTPITWSQLNAALSYSAGSGISISGATIGVNFGVVAALANPDFTGTVTLPAVSAAGGLIDLTGASELKVPSPSGASDAATKAYVDLSGQELGPKPAATWATAAALPSNTYSNGSAGSNATLTGNANGALTVDGGAVAIGDTVLVKNESTAAHNGLYVVTNSGGPAAAYVLTRSTAMDTSQKYPGATVPVLGGGAANGGTQWLCNLTTAPSVGTTAISFILITGVFAGTGILLNSGTVSADFSTVARVASPTFTGTVSLPAVVSTGGTVNLTGAAEVTVPPPENASDAVTLSFLTTTLTDFPYRTPVTAATTAALPSCTYANGSSGVGATLTGTANGLLTVDGQDMSFNFGSAVNTVLVKNEATQSHNGVYVVTQSGGVSTPFILTRLAGFDAPSLLNGVIVAVINGASNAATFWMCQYPASGGSFPAIGSAAIHFAQIVPSDVPVSSISPISDGDVLSNISGSTAAPAANTLSAIMDHILGSADGDIAVRSGGVWTAAGSLAYSQIPAYLGTSTLTIPFPGSPGSGAEILVPVTKSVEIPANFAGTIGYADTAPTATAIFHLAFLRAGSPTSIGTLSFLATQQSLTLSTQALVSLEAGDVLRLTAPSSPDSTLANVSISLLLNNT